MARDVAVLFAHMGGRARSFGIAVDRTHCHSSCWQLESLRTNPSSRVPTPDVRSSSVGAVAVESLSNYRDPLEYDVGSVQ